MKRMLLLGCLITILAFSSFGCSGGSKDAHAETITEVAPYIPISIRMFDVYAATEDGHVFYRPHDTKAWVTDEDEQAFVVGDNLRYGGRYGMDGMIDAPIIICKPINYYHSVRVASEEDYGITPDQIVEPPPYDGARDQRVDIRVYSSMGKLLWFFNAVYITVNDLDLYQAGGNLRFWSNVDNVVTDGEFGEQRFPHGTYLVQAPIVTITEDVLMHIIWTEETKPQGDSLD